ncbi:MAG: hypothetical protein HN929_07760 [Chloroflexi bacterium]|jgi:cyclophilin family peptidyl-prolyl cis-trans isomerase|nr:hypothetical protein [Chloroflexota bacterium]MBT7081344.1 hypothetical protein [Chloroflexota bacterium]MBT7290810.1 hypothetical protein [Chloroflexota bacterium]
MRRYSFLAIVFVLIAIMGLVITGCGQDTTDPTISDVTVTNITETSATINWTTNEPATTQLQYGIDDNYHTASTLSMVLKTDHTVTIDRLAPEITYHFRVKSKDAADNLSVSEDTTFDTPIDPTPNRTATIVTSMGDIVIELYENRTPVTTANFIALAQDGFYDGLIFHRVIDDFMIQTGDPNGDGTGGSDNFIVLETHPDLTHIDGTLSMARSTNPDSATSQFFICDGEQSFLNDNYAAFAQVTDGMDVVRAIAAVPVSAEKPITDVIMESVTIE